MKAILFVCTHDAGRSQMAQAFWRRHTRECLRDDRCREMVGHPSG